MTSALVPTLSVVFIVCLCVIAYFPLKARMGEADFLSLSYGPAIYNALPLLLTAFAMVFSLITIYITGNSFGVTSK